MSVTGSSRSTPYVLPFAVLLGALAVFPSLPMAPGVSEALRVGLLVAVLVAVARPALSFRLTSPMASVGLGILVFVVWIGPDLLVSGWHDHSLFRNVITGVGASSYPDVARQDAIALTFRILRAAILVPIIEELFWRAWLPRWMINLDFEKVPLGRYTPVAFILTAVLFASEHGAYWDVGLIAGGLYNWWMLRTCSLGDCILAHAVTNGCLAGYVLITGQWQYW